jgi:hypothetical protein
VPNSDERYPAKEVGEILGAALRGKKSTKRHPAEVTSDRLGDAVTRYADQFTPEEMDMVGQIRHRLETIAERATSATRPNAGGDPDA